MRRLAVPYRRRQAATSAFARLSTGRKMLIILSVALLPLGLIALFTSLESAHTNHLNREVEAHLMAADSARQLGTAIGTSSAALSRTVATFGGILPDRAACRRALNELRAGQPLPTEYGLFDTRARPICTTLGFSRAAARSPTPRIGTEVRILGEAQALRFSVAGPGMFAVGEYGRATVLKASKPRIASGGYGMILHQGDISLLLKTLRTESPLSREMTVYTPVANGQLALEMLVSATPIGALEVLMVLLPLLMWVAAAVIGWLVVDRLLLRPLGQLQRAVTSYRIGGGPLRIPVMTTPAQEIRSLGHAFRKVTQKVSAHEAQLEAGLARQTRLTREVHHRVKNNLQVISSLINLHARHAAGPEATTAYATIQRRVDALAVVHRNHTELEGERGVPLRPLLGELTANLRATAPPEAAGLTITLELMPAFVSQDTAVSVAFLVTELMELVMACDPRGRTAILLRPLEQADRAELSLVAPGLTDEACATATALPGFNRVVEGLARQLRAPLLRDDQGSFRIEIRIIPQPA
ncbi:MAG TPA: histidine kinase dimerization/phosphoacceptor domain -containing protein [Sphingomonadaceae bacterium]|nr:histidine kinase dimerization/phosphoacceptor domain -containing protein [Sphingomonadaceae bacterium]